MSLVAVAAALVTACSNPATTTTTDPTPGAPSDDATTTTTSLPSTTTTTTLVAPEVGAARCPAPDSDFSILCEAVALIEANYVDPVGATELMAAALAGLEQLEDGSSTEPVTCVVPDPEVYAPLCQEIALRDLSAVAAAEAAVVGIAEALDANSAYLTPTALELTREDSTGQVEGIGALVTTEDLTSDDPEASRCQLLSDTCRLVIVSTLEGSPAQAAGLQEGDQMVTVDGETITGRGFEEVTAIVRGPSGTDVRLGFVRDGRPFEVTITRAAVDIPVATWEMVGNVGYVRLNFFTLNAGEQIRSALEEVLAAGATTLVLDLRNNPGGTLTAAIDVASEFLADGLVLITQAPDEETPYEVEPGGVATDDSLRLVVILNRGSASASEVVAGALQESGRATIVGDASFGKNTVQQRFPLSNGGAFKLTIARWVTPDGTDFGGDGIQPDGAVDIDGLAPVPEVVAAALAAAGL
jgi:carboxyl-terminal processing protease